MIYTKELADNEEAVMMNYIVNLQMMMNYTENLQMMKSALMTMIMLMRWSKVQYKDPTEVCENEFTDDTLKGAKERKWKLHLWLL